MRPAYKNTTDAFLLLLAASGFAGLVISSFLFTNKEVKDFLSSVFVYLVG